MYLIWHQKGVVVHPRFVCSQVLPLNNSSRKELTEIKYYHTHREVFESHSSEVEWDGSSRCGVAVQRAPCDRPRRTAGCTPNGLSRENVIVKRYYAFPIWTNLNCLALFQIEAPMFYHCITRCNAYHRVVAFWNLN